LYRGVPGDSPEVQQVLATGEVLPRNPSRWQAEWRQAHSAGNTDTAFTSWTSQRSIAVNAAEEVCTTEELECGVVVFRVLLANLPDSQIFPGRPDEDEYLLWGVIENVEISTADSDEETGDP
jgi:hypothetical protein